MVLLTTDYTSGGVYTYGIWRGHPGFFMRSDATQIQRHLTWIFLEIPYYQYDAELADPNLTRVMWLCREMPAAIASAPIPHMHSRYSHASRMLHAERTTGTHVGCAAPRNRKHLRHSDVGPQTFDVFCLLACHHVAQSKSGSALLRAVVRSRPCRFSLAPERFMNCICRNIYYMNNKCDA